MNSKKKTIIVFSILLVVILLLGGTYAWLKVTVVSESNQVIHAGKLDLILDDEASNGINMENVVPTSDTKGREQEGYQFKLINRGNKNSKYTVYLDDLDLNVGEKRMEDSAVKYSLERDGVELSSGLLPEIGSNPNRILDTGVISGKTTYTYLLKVWMDIDATSENMDTIFYTKIRVETEQENIPITKSEMELTPESVEKVPIEDGEDPKKYTYTSSDWNVVKVDEEGNIEVIGPGYAVITKTDPYGEKEEITVHVTVPVEATFETNDKIESIGTITNNTCNLTENKQTTCQISLPEVVVKDGYEFVGWSTEENSHEGEQEKADISKDKSTLYPIVKKIGATHQVTLIDNVEGVESIGSVDQSSCKVEDTYNNEPIKTSCDFTLPEINAESGYTVIGWSTDSNATTGITPGSKVEINGPSIFYPIVKKDATTITATFKLNGATALDGKSSDITKSCEIHTNSAGEPIDNCEVTVPVITASSQTPNIIGFNEDKEATTGQITPGTVTITINENKTYYALTKSDAKDYTVTFYRNGAKSLGGDANNTVTSSCRIGVTYNGEAQAKSCEVTSPSIEASDNTPRVIGYSTSEDVHESSWNAGEAKQISSDRTLYAQTANDNDITYRANFEVGANVTRVGQSSATCKVNPSYNGAERENSCSVAAPTVTPKIGYTSVGYSETENDTTGNMSLILTKNTTTFYANAVANSYKIEYYSEGEKVGESGAQVGTAITLTTKEALGIEKRGYSFKGWSTDPAATTGTYADGSEVSNLSTTEGAVVKLYAVWIDDIAPVCTFSELQDSYTVGDRFNITLTCSDEGSGLVDTGKENIDIVSHFITSGSTKYEYFKINSTSCDFQNGILTCQYELEANATPYHDSWSGEYDWKGFVSLPSKKIFDQNQNTVFHQSKEANVFGKTITATMTQDGIEGMSNLESTTQSCTTEYDNRSCNVELGNSLAADEHYRWAGWSTDKTAVQGGYEFTLTEDTTFYPVTGPVFEAAYTYNQTAGAANYCVTGEEETCEVTTCYKDSGNCASGTIFKYAVKSTYPDERRVDSLNNHVYYFHVLHDDGDKLTLQSRENLKSSENAFIAVNWNDSNQAVADGPTRVISAIEGITNSWDYVNSIHYTMGTTEFLGNANTDCWVDSSHVVHCNKISYNWPEKTAKARIITAQEASNVGCLEQDQSCPIWMYNYSKNCINYGCTNEETATQENYATMSSAAVTDWAWLIYSRGRLARNNIHNLLRGVRPVIELDKSKFVR